MIFLQTPPETIEITFSLEFAEFMARAFHCLLFHLVGISLCLASSVFLSPSRR